MTTKKARRRKKLNKGGNPQASPFAVTSLKEEQHPMAFHIGLRNERLVDKFKSLITKGVPGSEFHVVDDSWWCYLNNKNEIPDSAGFVDHIHCAIHVRNRDAVVAIRSYLPMMGMYANRLGDIDVNFVTDVDDYENVHKEPPLVRPDDY